MAFLIFLKNKSKQFPNGCLVLISKCCYYFSTERQTTHSSSKENLQTCSIIRQGNDNVYGLYLLHVLQSVQSFASD